MDKIKLVISGCATGIDSLAIKWAENNKIQVKKMPADWQNLDVKGVVIRTNDRGEKYNAAAGFQRNKKMAEIGDTLLCIWDGKSRGSQNMIDEAEKTGLKVYVYEV